MDFERDPAYQTVDYCARCRTMPATNDFDMCSGCLEHTKGTEAKKAELDDQERGIDLWSDGRPLSDCETPAQRRGWMWAEVNGDG